jgi:hypothetical protein
MLEPKKMGRPAKLTDHRPFTLRLPTDLHRQLRHLTVDQGVSLNDLLVQIIVEWWAKQPQRATYANLKSTAEPRRTRKPSASE